MSVIRLHNQFPKAEEIEYRYELQKGSQITLQMLFLYVLENYCLLVFSNLGKKAAGEVGWGGVAQPPRP